LDRSAVRPEIRNTIFRDLAQRKFDMVAAGAVIAPDKASFSDPYLPADLALMVKPGGATGKRGGDYARNETGARFVRTYALVDDAYNSLAASGSGHRRPRALRGPERRRTERQADRAVRPGVRVSCTTRKRRGET
jgi:ABC-type amino acid transport substrate-binding protein